MILSRGIFPEQIILWIERQQMIHLDFYVKADEFDEMVKHAITCGAKIKEKPCAKPLIPESPGKVKKSGEVGHDSKAGKEWFSHPQKIGGCIGGLLGYTKERITQTKIVIRKAKAKFQRKNGLRFPSAPLKYV